MYVSHTDKIQDIVAEKVTRIYLSNSASRESEKEDWNPKCTFKALSREKF
jgi:hypothetical protein